MILSTALAMLKKMKALGELWYNTSKGGITMPNLPLPHDHGQQIEKELEHIENYLYIQNTRFGNALVFEKDITVTEFQIPPLSVQPLIENAIKYGIRKNGNHGTIRLETKQTAEGICILVKNSGPGFDEQKINPHHSIQNIRSRMDYLLHGTLIIHSQEGVEGTVMELLLPYQNQT